MYCSVPDTIVPIVPDRATYSTCRLFVYILESAVSHPYPHAYRFTCMQSCQNVWSRHVFSFSHFLIGDPVTWLPKITFNNVLIWVNIKPYLNWHDALDVNFHWVNVLNLCSCCIFLPLGKADHIANKCQVLILVKYFIIVSCC